MYPAWTADGTRPWHHRTHDRALPDGRTVRVWLGSVNHGRLGAYLNECWRLGDGWMALRDPERYWQVWRMDKRVMPHPGPCSPTGFLGIAYLPANPRPTTAPWPRWRHLAHATHAEDWTDLLPEYERIIALPDAELVALLEG